VGLDETLIDGMKSVLIYLSISVSILLSAIGGNPSDDNGIVIFAEDRLALREIVAEIPSSDYATLFTEDFNQFQNIDELKKFFRSHGSRRAKDLTEQI